MVVDLCNDPASPRAFEFYTLPWLPEAKVFLTRANYQCGTLQREDYYDPLDPRTGAVLKYPRLHVQVDRGKTAPTEWVRDGVGELSDQMMLLVPPVYDEVGSYDPHSGLTWVTKRDEKGTTSGYVNSQGVFKIVKGATSKY